MMEMKVVFFLVALVSGGAEGSFTITRLATFDDKAACDKAATTVRDTLGHGEKKGSAPVAFDCVGSDRVTALLKK